MRQLSVWLWFAIEGATIRIVACHLSKMDELPGFLLDAPAGASGALLVAWFIAPLSATGSPIEAPSVILAALGAVFLISLVKMVKR